jgi:hypothetical protein
MKTPELTGEQRASILGDSWRCASVTTRAASSSGQAPATPWPFAERNNSASEAFFAVKRG